MDRALVLYTGSSIPIPRPRDSVVGGVYFSWIVDAGDKTPYEGDIFMWLATKLRDYCFNYRSMDSRPQGCL